MQMRLNILFLFFIFFGVTACNNIVSKEERMAHLRSSENDIYIGIVDTIPNATQFVNGVKLAIDELNTSGGIMGKQIIPLIYYDYNNKKSALKIASKLSNNPDVIAVIGHFDPEYAISASILYKEAGIVFISTGTDLLRYGGDYIFNNYMHDMDYVDKITDFIKEENFSQIAILNDRHERNKILAENFYGQAVEKKINITFHKSFSPNEKNFRDLLSGLKLEKFDIIFLVCRDLAASLLINQMREMDIRVPIIGTYEIDTQHFWSQTGKNAEGMIIPTNFYAKNPRKLTQDFVKSFSVAFGVDPDEISARGYDFIRLLKDIMYQKNSYLPLILDTGIRFMGSWDGVLSRYQLTRKGQISPSELFYKKYDNGKFIYLKQKAKKKEDTFELVEEITLRLAVNDNIATMDPGFAHDTTSIEVCKQLFLNLTQYNDKNCEPEPDFALSWKANEDQNAFRYHLRKDVYWTNGEPVTAHDIVWAIQRNLRSKPDVPDIRHLFILKNARAIHNGEIKDLNKLGITVIDDYTLDFQLEYPAAYFPAFTGLPVYSPLPSKAIQKWGKEWTRPKNIQTNGPYRLVFYETDASAILRKNPTYFNASRVSIEEIRYNIIPNNINVLYLYKSNQLDIVGGPFSTIPLNYIQTVKKEPETRFNYKKGSYLSTLAFAFNIQQSPVDNILLRKAIASVIDRHFITRFIAFGYQIAEKSFTPEILMSEKIDSAAHFHPIHAQKMMTEAGYFNGHTCPEIIIETGTTVMHQKIVKAVSLLLKKHLNISTKIIDPMHSKTSSSHLRIQKYDASYPDADSFLYDSYILSRHYTHFNSDQISTLHENAIKEKSRTLRNILYEKIDNILIQKECILIPIYYDTAHYLVQSRVKGWNHMPFGGQLINSWQLEEE